MTEEKPKDGSMGVASRIGGGLLLLWAVWAILAHFFGSPDPPNGFPRSQQYTPNQAEMLWRMERSKASDAELRGDDDAAARWRRSCERDTGVPC